MLRQGRDALQRSSTQLKTPKVRLLSRSLGVFKCLSGIITIPKSALKNKGAVLVIVCLFVPLSVLLGIVKPAHTSAAPSTYLNFQGRLTTNTGSLVPDGTYNIQFNLYNVSAGGSTQWTETYLVSGTPVTIKNGFFSVQLGSQVAFPGTINWDQQQWLGMTVRGTTSCVFGSCSPADAEMTPRFQLTSVPFAQSAATALGVSSDAQSAAATPTGNIIIQSGNASGTGVASVSGNISIDAGSSTNSTTGTISLAATNASSLILGRAGLTTLNSGALTVTQLGRFNGGLTVATGNTFTNASSTLLTALPVVNQTANGNIPAGGAGNTGASTTVDVATTFNITQTTGSLTLSLPTPTVATAGRLVYVNNVGSTSFVMHGSTIAPGGAQTYIWNGSAWIASGVSGTGSGVTTVGALNGGTANANGTTITGTTIYLQSASASFAGLVDTTTQTFAGVKTFNGQIIAAGGITSPGAGAGSEAFGASATSAGLRMKRRAPSDSNCSP